MNRKYVKKRRHSNNVEHKMVTMHDQLQEFEQFREQFLPAIRADLMNKKLTPQQLLEKYQKLAAGKMVMDILSSNELVSRKASQDILDRTGGRPKETKEVRHRYADLNEQQLEAMLNTQLSELSPKQLPRGGASEPAEAIPANVVVSPKGGRA